MALGKTKRWSPELRPRDFHPPHLIFVILDALVQENDGKRVLD
jgi:hypothetical protein